MTDDAIMTVLEERLRQCQYGDLYDEITSDLCDRCDGAGAVTLRSADAACVACDGTGIGTHDWDDVPKLTPARCFRGGEQID